MWYWHVFVQACDLTTTQAVTAFVEIDYYCELYARIAGVTAPDTAFEGPTGATGTFTTSFDVIAGSTRYRVYGYKCNNINAKKK